MIRGPEHIGWRVVATLTAVSIGVLACGNDPDEEQAALIESVTVPPADMNSAPFTITFDYLGANSRTIRVYNGPNDTEFDRRAAGTYFDDDSETALCVTEGRVVNSVPPEEAMSSNIWVGLDGNSDNEVDYFASDTYIEESAEQLRTNLDPC